MFLSRCNIVLLSRCNIVALFWGFFFVELCCSLGSVSPCNSHFEMIIPRVILKPPCPRRQLLAECAKIRIIVLGLLGTGEPVPCIFHTTLLASQRGAHGLHPTYHGAECTVTAPT